MKHCLVIDDSSAIRKAARSMAEDLGFEVGEAGNGIEALEACRRKMPDVVLLDWNMPLMDGIEFLSALRARKDAFLPKVIYCTSSASADQIVQAISAGASEYLVKPYDKRLLEGKLAGIGLLAA